MVCLFCVVQIRVICPRSGHFTFRSGWSATRVESFYTSTLLLYHLLQIFVARARWYVASEWSLLQPYNHGSRQVPSCYHGVDNKVRYTRSNAIKLTPITIGLSDCELKAICLFLNAAREKSNANPQANFAFKMDKREQFSMVDYWLTENLGTYLGITGVPAEYSRVTATWSWLRWLESKCVELFRWATDCKRVHWCTSLEDLEEFRNRACGKRTAAPDEPHCSDDNRRARVADEDEVPVLISEVAATGIIPDPQPALRDNSTATTTTQSGTESTVISDSVSHAIREPMQALSGCCCALTNDQLEMFCRMVPEFYREIARPVIPFFSIREDRELHRFANVSVRHFLYRPLHNTEGFQRASHATVRFRPLLLTL